MSIFSQYRAQGCDSFDGFAEAGGHNRVRYNRLSRGQVCGDLKFKQFLRLRKQGNCCNVPIDDTMKDNFILFTSFILNKDNHIHYNFFCWDVHSNAAKVVFWLNIFAMLGVGCRGHEGTL